MDADVQIPVTLNLLANQMGPDNLDYQLGFGASVSLDGNRMIVGMPIAGVPGPEGQNTQDGRLFVYELGSTGQIVEEISTSLTVTDAIEDGGGPFGNTSVAARRFGRAVDANSGYLLVSLREDINDGGWRGLRAA